MNMNNAFFSLKYKYCVNVLFTSVAYVHYCIN